MDITRIILGTAGLGGVWGKVDPDTASQTILRALENGITAIDTAPAYGDAELLVGHALQQWSGRVPVISTKVGRRKTYAADHAVYDYSNAAMRESVHNSLRTLGVPAVDVLFLHDPEAVPVAQMPEVMEVMQSLKQQGLAKKIGLGGNIPACFEPFMSSFDVIMEFNRLNACNVAALKERLPSCLARGMAYYAASPLNMGLLGRNFETWQQYPPAWLSKKSLAVAQQLHHIAVMNDMTLPALAQRFLLNIPMEFNIVLGASSVAELENSLAALREGPLAEDLYRTILTFLSK
ncbi:MAG: aldo/keto reductase [Chitinophaga sp.]|uniref:aldo/keto reductase n=1 Tax=Chitinophaga sp. TaxID=1869181 RepID=UPI0025B87FA9|nr:aldo/keto reductase [Chitinophaga sp.]MBV8251894.1 aldo/keto reductase [Chitinophaga sp.]